MIRHIVFFRFKKEVDNSAREIFADTLRALKDSIDEVIDMEVAFDSAHTPNSYDLALNSTFGSIEAVNRYAVDEAHIKVLEDVKKLCEAVSKIDYSFNEKDFK